MKPNLLLINCDDLGYGDLGCYGSVRNDTPCLDELAAGGRRFTDFYMASPVCSPSRGAMMTGCYPPRIGFGSFHDDWVLFPGDDIGLHPDEYTMGDLFKEAGYATMAVGKWHCGDQPEFLPTRHGFDDYYGLPYSNDMAPMEKRPDMPPLPLISGEEVIEQQPDQTALTERYVERSVRFMRENKDRPFFLYLAHMHVHLPLYAAAPFVKASRNGDYGACVAAIDWATKALVHELKTLGLLENTLIIFTSDNGSRNDRGDSNGPLRGTKATTWEGGQRVPFIVYWKDHIKPGVNEEIICALDLLPSFAAMLGIDLPTDRVLDGVNQWELLTGQTEQSNRDTFYYYMCENLEAVRRQNWKLHVSRRPDAGKPSSDHDGTAKTVVPIRDNQAVRELYDLSTDIGEKNNVYDEYPEVVARLMETVEAARADLGDTFTGSVGKKIRPIGRVEHARPLTAYDPDHPYIISLYDRNEVG
jgi:arylsulfatase A-like enzyme